MAIERMTLMNIVVPKQHIFHLLKELIIYYRTEFIDAKKTIDETSFLLAADLENAEKIREFNDVKAFKISENVDEELALLEEIEQRCGVRAALDKGFLDKFEGYFEPSEGLLRLREEVSKYLDKIKVVDDELEDLRVYQELAEAGIDFPIGKLSTLQNFELHMGWLDQLAVERLSRSAGDFPPLYVKLGRRKDKELCLFVFPKEIAAESMRVVRSLRLDEIAINPAYVDVEPGEESDRLFRAKQAEKDRLERELSDQISKKRDMLNHVYSHLMLEKEMRSVLQNLAESEHYAYLSMWTPRRDAEAIRRMVEEDHQGQCNILRSKEARKYEKAPTSMKNNFFVRPFERLVLMYGVPDYEELDPTGFFALAYMILFGVMFGDLGQGLVFFIAGLILKKKRHPGMGGVVSRLGLASMVAGVFYDSFFGYEGVISHLIPLPIYLHPFENTNLMLIASVGFGLILLSIAYIIGIINKFRVGENAEAYFGKEGIAGYVFFLGFLFMVAAVIGKPILPLPLAGALLGVSAALMLFREPLYRALTKQSRLHIGKVSDYYVENTFNLVETLLGVLSNSLSFIRVGAFALNHVGLFLAFHTLADMLNSPVGSVTMGILGNVVILGLEGLIVFIQDLRLMYYELFSKYFIGDGREFKPAGLKEV